ncbi:hypothetical protein [Rhodoferax sp.]|uniref:hypothetical protein n=1 Tax=Rhodoferax sp. TaxID=50421 RepID=UPI0027744F5D|nr:hypothetical protein [Rhodoferax sp.]
MDKRDFLKVGAGGGLGIAAATAAAAVGAVGAAAIEPPLRSSAEALRDLRVAFPSQRAQSILAQVELITKATATAQDRIAFIRNPITFAHQHGVELDRDFAALMREEMRGVERKASTAFDQARKSSTMANISSSAAPTALPVIMAAAAVVSALAAVVSAVSLTYVATKWEVEYQ